MPTARFTVAGLARAGMAHPAAVVAHVAPSRRALGALRGSAALGTRRRPGAAGSSSSATVLANPFLRRQGAGPAGAARPRHTRSPSTVTGSSRSSPTAWNGSSGWASRQRSDRVSCWTSHTPRACPNVELVGARLLARSIGRTQRRGSGSSARDTRPARSCSRRGPGAPLITTSFNERP